MLLGKAMRNSFPALVHLIPLAMLPTRAEQTKTLNAGIAEYYHGTTPINSYDVSAHTRRRRAAVAPRGRRGFDRPLRRAAARHEPPPTRRGRTRTTQGRHRRMAPWRVGLPPTPLVGQHTIRLDRASATAFARSGPLRLGSADLGPLTGHPFEGDTVVCTAGPPEYTYCVLFNNPSPRGCSRRRATRTIVHVNVLITHASDAPKHRETEARIPTSQTQFPNLPNTG